MIPWLAPGQPFPDIDRALGTPNGLLAAGGELSPARLLDAYRRGIFPWFNPGEPILWWSPDPRMVLFPEEIRIARSLKRRLRQADYTIAFDRDFDAVVRACAGPRRGARGTWITPAMRAAYGRLHRLGHAHCIEMYVDGALVGGLYGVALGRVFFGESMFSHIPNASKIALAHLAMTLHRKGYTLIDCQVPSAHLASLGARELPRSTFAALLQQQIDGRQPADQTGSWSHWTAEPAVPSLTDAQPMETLQIPMRRPS
ncbi:MAG TPA: leucyl/phenylalanyl-tRNA--protein transferase [Rhodocyclaceae bacterium]|nr:leucyl/phenylalanyl-tRNA--protein transferase [Rhodocyclaceae bacterium]